MMAIVRPDRAALEREATFFGGVGQIQVEVNWLMRICLLPPMQRTSKLLSSNPMEGSECS